MFTLEGSGTTDSSGNHWITGQTFFHVLPPSNHQFFTFDERNKCEGVSAVDFLLPGLDYQAERRP